MHWGRDIGNRRFISLTVFRYPVNEMNIALESLAVHASYSEKDRFVFQYIGLRSLVRELGEEKARQVLEKNIPRLLENTEKVYRIDMARTLDDPRLFNALLLIQEAKESYESGKGEISIFYGNYQDEKRRIVFEFKRNPLA